jgi:hypothetical protein
LIQDKPFGGIRGMPRPICVRDDTMRPVPWSQGEAWGSASTHRQQLAIAQSRCLVCGEVVRKGVVFVRTTKTEAAEPDHPPVKGSYDINDLPYNSAIVEGAIHEKCAKLTRAHCKPVRNRLKDGIYVERPYERKRYRPGMKPKVEYR